MKFKPMIDPNAIDSIFLSGYLPVSAQTSKSTSAGLAYVFYSKREAKKEDLHLYPTVISLNGLPHRTSLIDAYMYSGPYNIQIDTKENHETIKVKKNPAAWTDEFNVLYIDQSVGVFFSHFDPENHTPKEFKEFSNQLYYAINTFISNFVNPSKPTLKQSQPILAPIFIYTSDRNALLAIGLAEKILDYPSQITDLSLKGIILQNPLIDSKQFILTVLENSNLMKGDKKKREISRLADGMSEEVETKFKNDDYQRMNRNAQRIQQDLLINQNLNHEESLFKEYGKIALLYDYISKNASLFQSFQHQYIQSDTSTFEQILIKNATVVDSTDIIVKLIDKFKLPMLILDSSDKISCSQSIITKLNTIKTKTKMFKWSKVIESKVQQEFESVSILNCITFAHFKVKNDYQQYHSHPEQDKHAILTMMKTFAKKAMKEKSSFSKFLQKFKQN